MPLRACISTAAVSPSGPYITGPRDSTASSIANLLSMVSYGCSVHSHVSCSVQPVVGRETPMDMESKQALAGPEPRAAGPSRSRQMSRSGMFGPAVCRLRSAESGPQSCSGRLITPAAGWSGASMSIQMTSAIPTFLGVCMSQNTQLSQAGCWEHPARGWSDVGEHWTALA